jgi:hypothetical protein
LDKHCDRLQKLTIVNHFRVLIIPMPLSPLAVRTIFRATLLAGTLDGLAAAVKYVANTGKDPMNVFRFIASGVFGPKAFVGGITMGLWGIFFHYLIATGWVVLFFVVYPRIKLLSRNKYITGLSYGIIVWVTMNLVVLPLSNVPPLVMNSESIIIGMIILMTCIGLPISIIVNRHYTQTQ